MYNKEVLTDVKCVRTDKHCDTHKQFMCQLNQSVQLDNYGN